MARPTTEDLLLEAEELADRLERLPGAAGHLRALVDQSGEQLDAQAASKAAAGLSAESAAGRVCETVRQEALRLLAGGRRTPAELARVAGWASRILRVREFQGLLKGLVMETPARRDSGRPAEAARAMGRTGRPPAPGFSGSRGEGREARERPGRSRRETGGRPFEPSGRGPAGGRFEERGPRGRRDGPRRPEPAPPIRTPPPAPGLPVVRERLWPSAVLQWRKQDRTLVALREGVRAERKLGDDLTLCASLPEAVRARLFEKGKEVPGVRVVVRPVGSGHEIVRVEGLSVAEG